MHAVFALPVIVYPDDVSKPQMWVPMTRFRYLKFATVLIAVLLFAIISVIAVSIRQQSANADALWKIVHGRCVPDMKTKHNPAPCVSVNLAQGEAGGFAILKDAKGNTQYLVIPTAKITGIESPPILAPNAINYFSEAWAVTDLVDQRQNHTLPRTDFAIAINSVSGRSQNQLHIHVDCIQPRAKSVLEQLGPEIGTTWQRLTREAVEARVSSHMAPRHATGSTQSIPPTRQLPAGSRAGDGWSHSCTCRSRA